MESQTRRIIAEQQKMLAMQQEAGDTRVSSEKTRIPLDILFS